MRLYYCITLLTLALPIDCLYGAKYTKEDIRQNEIKIFPNPLKTNVKIWETSEKRISFKHYTLGNSEDPADVVLKSELLTIRAYKAEAQFKLEKSLADTLEITRSNSIPKEKIKFSGIKTYLVCDADLNWWIVEDFTTAKYLKFNIASPVSLDGNVLFYQIQEEDSYFWVNGSLNIIQ